jgi:hypothetical protein
MLEPTSVKCLLRAPFNGILLAFPSFIGLDLKGLPGKNTLAYCENSQITDTESI